MDSNATLASAAVGAVVATVVTLGLRQYQKIRDTKAQQAEVHGAWHDGRIQGYYEGRESLMTVAEEQDEKPTEQLA